MLSSTTTSIGAPSLFAPSVPPTPDVPQQPAWASGGASPTVGVESKLQMGNQILGQLLQLFQNLFPRTIGTFTMAAASSKVVTDANVTSASTVVLVPTNAAAGTLMGSAKSLYVTVANGSFTVATASAASAAGTEQFKYVAFQSL